MTLGKTGERIAYILSAGICGFIILIGNVGVSIISIIWYYWTYRDFPYSENDFAIRLYNLQTAIMSLFVVEIIILIILAVLFFVVKKYCPAFVILFIEMLLIISSLVMHCVTIGWSTSSQCDKILQTGLSKGKTRDEYITWRDQWEYTEEHIWDNQCSKPSKTFLGFFIVECIGILFMALTAFPLSYKVISRMRP